MKLCNVEGSRCHGVIFDHSHIHFHLDVCRRHRVLGICNRMIDETWMKSLGESDQ